MDSYSDPWETWTTSYGERCIENEHSLHDALLQSEKSDSYELDKNTYTSRNMCTRINNSWYMRFSVFFLVKNEYLQ